MSARADALARLLARGQQQQQRAARGVVRERERERENEGAGSYGTSCHRRRRPPAPLTRELSPLATCPETKKNTAQTQNFLTFGEAERMVKSLRGVAIHEVR